MIWNFADAALLVEVAAMNLMLSGDNIVIVGLALRELPLSRRRTISIAGITAAVVMETAAALMVASVLAFPVVECAAGILLTWIAIRLVRDNSARGDRRGEPSDNLRHPVLTVIIAYLSMCPDNILAVASLSRGHPVLLASGLLLSCALLIPGSLLIAEMMKRFPLLVMCGAAVLGWTAGTMIAVVLPHAGNSLADDVVRIVPPLLLAVAVVTSPLWFPAGRVRYRQT